MLELVGERQSRQGILRSVRQVCADGRLNRILGQYNEKENVMAGKVGQ